MEIKLRPYQHKYLDSANRFPALVGGIGTGKTFMLLLKVWRFCETFPGARALITRNEYTDLHDSTIKDFEQYFNVKVGSDKEYEFANKSVIMFRHGSELNTLKNITLDIAAIEQAEEFADETQFVFIRDRLRGRSGPYQQLCLIANANGHNWIWKLWVNNPGPEYDLTLANSFENECNLPPGFIADLRRMEVEAPNHYRQYVMNSFEEVTSDDILLPHSLVYGSPNLVCPPQGSFARVMGVDVGRYGEDETVFTVIEARSLFFWEQVSQQTYRETNLMDTVGRIMDIERMGLDLILVDDIGVGGGVVDRLEQLKTEVRGFGSAEKSGKELYTNKRSEGWFFFRDMLIRGNLKIMNDEQLMSQLTSIKFGYGAKEDKFIVSKEKMRKDGFKSPDRADALMMAVWGTQEAFDRGGSVPGMRPEYGSGDDDRVHSTHSQPAFGICS